MFRKMLIALIMVAVLAGFAIPAFAQTTGTRTITVTEEDINNSYRVTNSPRRSISDVAVDLQPGQAVISATVTLRGRDPVATVSTITPSITNGRLYWTVTAVTANGEAVSTELLAQINASIGASWRTYIRRQMGTGRISTIDINDTEIVLTVSTNR